MLEHPVTLVLERQKLARHAMRLEDSVGGEPFDQRTPPVTLAMDEERRGCVLPPREAVGPGRVPLVELFSGGRVPCERGIAELGGWEAEVGG